MVRSDVGKEHDYHAYKQELRWDFWYSCAYCSIAESEANSIRFEIDHYLPQKPHPELVADYANLYWSCELCNGWKSKCCPNEDLRLKGLYFIRVDKEDPRDHLDLRDGDRLGWITKTGEFNVKTLVLNRSQLRELRSLRGQFSVAREAIAHGVRVLKHSHIDQIHDLSLRSYVHHLISRNVRLAKEAWEQIDGGLRDALRSSANDPDPDRASDTRLRREYLRDVGAMMPSRSSARRGGGDPKKA